MTVVFRVDIRYDFLIRNERNFVPVARPAGGGKAWGLKWK